MAEERSGRQGIFRQSAMNRIASADDLDKYIKVTNPSAWIVLFSALFLLAGLAIWSMTAVIPTTVDLTGMAVGDEILCCVDKDTAKKIESGDAYAMVNGERVNELSVDSVPFSRAEASDYIGSEYLKESVTLSDWNYMVSLKTSEKVTEEGDVRLIPVSITVSETHPLALVFGNN